MFVSLGAGDGVHIHHVRHAGRTRRAATEGRVLLQQARNVDARDPRYVRLCPMKKTAAL